MSASDQPIVRRPDAKGTAITNSDGVVEHLRRTVTKHLGKDERQDKSSDWNEGFNDCCRFVLDEITIAEGGIPHHFSLVIHKQRIEAQSIAIDHLDNENKMLRKAIRDIRDCVLHERCQLAEAGLDCDQVNAVLDVIDDHVALEG